MKRIAIIALLTACTALSVQAQQLKFGGAVLNHDIMLAEDFANLSQTQNFGTARSMAMGGAFTSLGADLSSMSQNPAGMGMYRSNDFSITPIVSLANATTSGTTEWNKNNRGRFALANIGMAINVFESSSSPLTSLTFGFGMNRIADFNTRYSYSTESRYDPATPNRLMPTIADIFGQQLGQAGVFPQPGENGNPNGSLGYKNPYLWPAVMGYNGYMISVSDTDGGKQWGSDCIGRNASVIHSMDVLNSGSINEFTLSMGANINNVLYLGATLGIQSVYKKSEVIYQEEYNYYNSDGYALDRNGDRLPQQLGYANMLQETVHSGSGVNFKLGAIVRPIAGLRLGVAFHTPTFYSLNRSYKGNIQSLLLSNLNNDQQYNNDSTPVMRDEGPNSWEFVSPTRLMFGASYTFGRIAIVSVDYERNWYNGIRVKNVPQDTDFSLTNYKEMFKYNFCATNALRAGIEVRPVPMLALRLGGGVTTSMLKDESLYFDTPVATSSHYITAGIGLSLSRSVVLDFAYQNMTQKQSQYELFYSRNAETGDFKTYSGLYDTQITRHFISMTFGFRF